MRDARGVGCLLVMSVSLEHLKCAEEERIQPASSSKLNILRLHSNTFQKGFRNVIRITICIPCAFKLNGL